MKRTAIQSLLFLLLGVDGFLSTTRSRQGLVLPSLTSNSPSSSALNVWWFGGTEQSEVNGNNDSCELVAVRIERTSPNSRRIAGEITVPARVNEVWSILTDYDRLAIHVPNLMESKVKKRNSGGEAGDGQFRCRLYQVGSQNIIGFDFSASVTMDMTERIISAAASTSESFVPEERMIGFKCVDSQFFTEFDGEWKVKEQIGPDGEIETVVSYLVDVRPKGPVPVAALEWQIREEVPTNLRAVKAATMKLHEAMKRSQIPPASSNQLNAAVPVRDVSSIRARASRNINGQYPPRLVPVLADWDADETLAKYL